MRLRPSGQLDAALLFAERQHMWLWASRQAYGSAEPEIIRGQRVAVERVLAGSPAESPAGLRAKARALQRTLDTRNALDRRGRPPGLDSAGRLIWSLLDDVLRLQDGAATGRGLAGLAGDDAPRGE